MAYRRHFFVCTNRRPAEAGMPSCGHNGSQAIAVALRRARDAHGLIGSVYVTETACLGPCPAAGATVVVYPEAVWYTGITDGDVAEIVAQHMVGGEPVERLRNPQWRLRE
jgi:(2Fe-2S) ferredoxin